MAQRGRDVTSSASKITEKNPGGSSVTTGSAWIVSGLIPINAGIDHCQTSKGMQNNQSFLVTTSQAMRLREADLIWLAEFAPREWLGTFKTQGCYCLGNNAIHEVSVCDNNTRLILIPTEHLHQQKYFSGWRENEFQSKRSLPCCQKENESQGRAANARQSELYCNVLTNQYSEKRYLLCVDDHESYFLKSHGNGVELRKLEHFQQNEIPKGAIILDKKGNGVGLLAFDDNGEVRPLFFPKNLFGSDEQGLARGLPINSFLKENNLEGSESNAGNSRGQQRSCGDGEEEKPQSHKGQHQVEETYAVQESELAGEKQQSIKNKPLIKRSCSEQQATKEKPRPDRLLSERNHIPLREEELVSDAVLSDIYVMDHLKNLLDRSVTGIKNWRYLADLNGVPIEKQLKWQLGEHHSRSEKMFEALTCTNPELSMRSLVKHLSDLGINNVANFMTDLKLEENMTAEEFFEFQNRNVIGKVLMKLDLIDKDNWWNLGIKIGMSAKSLKQIKIDCENRQENPGSHVINIIATSEPTMTIGQFKKKLANLGRKDVARKLNMLSEKSVIGKLLDNLDLVREVTSLLNSPDSPVLKNYKDLAADCGISREKYESLQPPCADSPTQKTIEEIVQRNPKFSVEELFKNLSDMERLDVIEAISPYYEEEDVLALKRKLRITDE
ncbi:uncharacterized protein LOC111324475 isoform X2 [Stylophora pistillata]|uniref:uncharacterized protein LOC111324475 isoform X2 n=1 Tax=Stylophora pistillata TaxID=50429 RepID=UPI000C03A539|nr:uncharacterized protein LOC111324475 isoform X2 [Stylophora pistillata]